MKIDKPNCIFELKISLILISLSSKKYSPVSTNGDASVSIWRKLRRLRLYLAIKKDSLLEQAHFAADNSD